MRAPLAGLELGVFGREFDLTAGDAAAFVDDVDGRLSRLVVPDAPRRNHAGEVAMMPDDDRAGGLRVDVLHERQIGSTERAARQGDFKKTAAG